MIEFAFHRPEPPCPSVTELETLPLADERTYVLDPYLRDEADRFNLFSAHCAYLRAEVSESDEDMVTEDHVLITSTIGLYRRWEDSHWAALYPELPVASSDLDDWKAAVVVSRDKGVWWEGCGPATPCAEGQEPTVQTHAWQTRFEGHVGNLEFYVHITFVAEPLPPVVELTILTIFRDLVLAVVDTYDRVN